MKCFGFKFVSAKLKVIYLKSPIKLEKLRGSKTAQFFHFKFNNKKKLWQLK